MGELLMRDRSPNQGALRALFASASRNSGRIVLPINESACDQFDVKPMFFCVHALSGSSASDFVALAQRLNDTVRFYGLQAPPKRVQDSQFGASIETIADEYANALETFNPSAPFLLGGWSIGAIIALEIAQKLRARGRVVELLVAIDHAPENTGAGLPQWSPLYLRDQLVNLPRWVRSQRLAKGGVIGPLVEEASATARAIWSERIVGRKAGRAPARHPVERFGCLDRFPESRQQFMKRIYEAAFAYQAKDYPDPMVIYEARTTTPIRLPQVGRIWGKIAQRSVTVPIDGTHLSIMTEPYVSAMAEDLQRRISKVLQ